MIKESKDAKIYFVSTRMGKFFKTSIIKEFCEYCEKEHGLNIKDVCTGSAYNMPIYLLGELEENYNEAMVFSVEVKGNQGYSIVLADSDEIDLLINELEKADEDENSWNIINKVYQIIESKNNNENCENGESCENSENGESCENSKDIKDSENGEISENS